MLIQNPIEYSTSSQWVHEYLNCINEYQFDASETYISATNNQILQKLMQNEVDGWRYGKRALTDSLIFGKHDFSDIKTYALAKLLIGNQLSEKQENRLNALRHYQDALKEVKSINETFLIREITFALIHFLQKNSRGELHLLELKEDYLSQIENMLQSPIDFFRKECLLIDIMMKSEEQQQRSDFKLQLLEAFDRLQKYTNEQTYSTMVYHQLSGIYLEVFEKNYTKSLDHFSMALEKANTNSYHFFQSKIPVLLHSIAIVHFRLEDYNKAITIFESLLGSKHFQKDLVAKMYINDWLFRCHEKLGNYKDALFYYTTFKEKYDSLDRRKHARLILQMENENAVSRKEKMINQLNNKNSLLKKHYFTLLPIAGGLLLLVIFFIWLYKKMQSKKTTLEHEKEDTLQEVQKLKQLVIKNHIILKDKTKVYITDLLYIKAEDHYIRVFTSDGKNHLVRGRLKDLEEQLPPNFIRTHRSYITNRNFVKQIQRNFFILTDGTEIPISRKFQKDWT